MDERWPLLRSAKSSMAEEEECQRFNHVATSTVAVMMAKASTSTP
jgi:hypothetical protein